MMRRYSFFLVLFILFVIEGTVFQIFSPYQYGVTLQFIPRWVFMLIIFAGIFRGRGVATLYGVVFGIMYDVIYSSVLGINTFGMGIIAYFFSVAIPFFQKNLAAAIFLTIGAVSMFEYFLYGMMLILGLTTMIHADFLYGRFLPSFAMNFMIIAVAAYPLRNWFIYLKNKSEEEGRF